MSLQLMHADILEPHLETLASLTDNPALFADFLCDPDGAGDRWLQLPLDVRKLEMLLLWARDEWACPTELTGPDESAIDEHSYRIRVRQCQEGLRMGMITMEHVKKELGLVERPNPNRLFPGKLSPAALGAWLTMVGDERGLLIGECSVDVRRPSGWAAWIADGAGIRYFDAESAAWLDLKRRVAALFSDLAWKTRIAFPCIELLRHTSFDPALSGGVRERLKDAGFALDFPVLWLEDKPSDEVVYYQEIRPEQFLPVDSDLQNRLEQQCDFPPRRYCTQEEVAERLGGTGSHPTLVDCIEQASATIWHFCGQRYGVDRLAQSNVVLQWAVAMAAYLYRRRRGDTPEGATTSQASLAYQSLLEVQAGRLSISDLASTGPKWENVRVDRRRLTTP